MNKLTITSSAQLREALEQFYAATAAPEVIEALTDYFRTHPQLGPEFETDRAIILTMADAAAIDEPADMEQRILAATCGSPRRAIWHGIRLWHAAAAAVAVIAVAAMWLLNSNGTAQPVQQLVAKVDTVETVRQQPAELPQAQPADTATAPTATPQPVDAVQRQPAQQMAAAQPSHTREVTDPEEAAQILASTLIRARQTIAQAAQAPAAIDPALNSINNSLNSLRQ